MTDTKHTPTPWEALIAPFDDTNRFLWIAVNDQENANPIVQLFNHFERGTFVFDNAAANAFFIVKACNAYEADQATIKELEEEMGLLQDEASLNEDSEEKLREENTQLRMALEMIAGKRQCPDNLMGNVDIAIEALKKAGVE